MEVKAIGVCSRLCCRQHEGGKECINLDHCLLIPLLLRCVGEGCPAAITKRSLFANFIDFIQLWDPSVPGSLESGAKGAAPAWQSEGRHCIAEAALIAYVNPSDE